MAGRYNENPLFIVMAERHNDQAKRRNTSLFRVDDLLFIVISQHHNDKQWVEIFRPHNKRLFQGFFFRQKYSAGGLRHDATA